MNGIYYSTIRIAKIKRAFAKRRNIDHIGYEQTKHALKSVAAERDCPQNEQIHLCGTTEKYSKTISIIH